MARLERESEYRLLLERRAVALGVADHVEFDDRFLSISELAELLHATDVFLTPYRNPEQIASGALTFAIAAGCAVISTPYLFAKDMLATGAGKLVPFDDVAAIETAVSDFIENPDSLAAARAEAGRIGADLAWPTIAAETAVVLKRPLRPDRGESRYRSSSSSSRRSERIICGRWSRRRDHPARHRRDPELGNGVLRRRRRSACARRARAQRADARSSVDPVLHRSLAFLQFAAGPEGTGMRNFMGYDRRWLDEPHIGDHVGRTIWALGEILCDRLDPGSVRAGADAPGCARSIASRGRLGADSCLQRSRSRASRSRSSRPRRRVLLERLVEQLASAYHGSAAGSWTWFEDRLAYDNARLSQALIVGGSALRRPDEVAIGLESLAWLGDECGPRRRHASPHGASWAGPR